MKRRGPRTAETSGELVGRSAGVGPHRLSLRVSPTPSTTGLPIVLVHGIVSSRYLLPTASALARGHRVVVLDLPGFGRSSRPPRALSVAALADTLAETMGVLGVDRPVVVGHSTGAQVVVDLAVRHPALAGGVVLVGPTGDPQIRSVMRLWSRWAVTAPREPLGFNALVLRELAEIGPLRMLAMARRFVSDPFAAKLERVGVPSLVVRGEHDRVAPMSWARRVSTQLGGAPLEVIPGVAHTVVYSAPHQLSDVVSAFVERVAAIQPPATI